MALRAGVVVLGVGEDSSAKASKSSFVAVDMGRSAWHAFRASKYQSWGKMPRQAARSKVATTPTDRHQQRKSYRMIPLSPLLLLLNLLLSAASSFLLHPPSQQLTSHSTR